MPAHVKTRIKAKQNGANILQGAYLKFGLSREKVRAKQSCLTSQTPFVIPNVNIRENVMVKLVVEKMVEIRFRLFGHVDYAIRRIYQI